MTKTSFIRTGPNGRKYRFQCEAVILGIPINPKLPASFEDTSNDMRSDRELSLWGVPFIRTYKQDGKIFYDVRRLDGGAWDRSTWHGRSEDQDSAVLMAVKCITAELYSTP